MSYFPLEVITHYNIQHTYTPPTQTLPHPRTMFGHTHSFQKSILLFITFLHYLLERYVELSPIKTNQFHTLAKHVSLNCRYRPPQIRPPFHHPLTFRNICVPSLFWYNVTWHSPRSIPNPQNATHWRNTYYKIADIVNLNYHPYPCHPHPTRSTLNDISKNMKK